MKGMTRRAPNAPGHKPRWTSSQKQAVGSARSYQSPLWFTVGRGVLNEVYFPRLDQACSRDLRLIVTDDQGFYCDEVESTHHQVEWIAPGVPAFRITNRCERFELEKLLVSDPRGPVVLMRVRFRPLQGERQDYRLHALLTAHLDNQGMDNTARLAEYKGVPLLAAERPGWALALLGSPAFAQRSVGYTGTSDGRSQLRQFGQLRETYDLAEKGNVALTGAIDLSQEEFLLALGLGSSVEEAALHARLTLARGLETVLEEFRREWERWQEQLLPLDDTISTAVLGLHHSKNFPGAIIASASIPWGTAHGDRSAGGYHVAWPRDSYEAAGGMLAAGAHDEARRVMFYFEATQEEEGHWPQCMWLDGTPHRSAVQLDEAAAPILLLEMARRQGLLRPQELTRLWPMVRKAVGYIVAHGPCSEQDRWEETSGYSPYTLATQIVALLEAADLAELHDERPLADFLRELADAWNDCIERWCYAEDTGLARQHQVQGYYVRLAPADRDETLSLEDQSVGIKNQPGEKQFPAASIVSPDALALVRLGLRSPHDQRILDTLRVLDALLKVETPAGPGWHRYNHDGYGEHSDGSPYDGSGIGRAWPLLTGERGHYELAAGHPAEAERLLETMRGFAGEVGLLSEQVWDSDDLPEQGLFRGQPTYSARPLVWAHAEQLKLLRSLRDGKVFDMPGQTVDRYLVQGVRARHTCWTFRSRMACVLKGQDLRLLTRRSASVRYSLDGWRTQHDAQTRPTGLGGYVLDLPTSELEEGAGVWFTFYWPEADRWEGENFRVEVALPLPSGRARPGQRILT